jgi:hypothetical protein
MCVPKRGPCLENIVLTQKTSFYLSILAPQSPANDAHYFSALLFPFVSCPKVREVGREAKPREVGRQNATLRARSLREAALKIVPKATCL